ncbi:MAG: hypothetical protein KJ914_13850 [Gammaproteobacteria bacterium]|nr:hypothetical protein [Gammaproteobacteria bacterium]MBU1725603.1 hypothetical protein [Gammaproteobacteria bacterium]MBU2005490.1 hypothetical protein [Gammaproteobacteria bacterium]
MKLQIERPYVEALIREFPDLGVLREQLKFGNKAELPCQQLSAPQLAFLHSLYAAAGAAMQERAAQLATLHRATGGGKTLTAEVYSEIIKRPLYRVHSGQLGLNVVEMETALKNTLTRAQRWGAVVVS